MPFYIFLDGEYLLVSSGGAYLHRGVTLLLHTVARDENGKDLKVSKQETALAGVGHVS